LFRRLFSGVIIALFAVACYQSEQENAQLTVAKGVKCGVSYLSVFKMGLQCLCDGGSAKSGRACGRLSDRASFASLTEGVWILKVCLQQENMHGKKKRPGNKFPRRYFYDFAWPAA